MFLILASVLSLTLVQASVSGDYCYTDSKICSALVESGYAYQVDNKTLQDREVRAIPKIFQAYTYVKEKVCEGQSADKKQECINCFDARDAAVADGIKKCFQTYPNSNFTRTNDYLNKNFNDTNITVELDVSRLSCYMNEKALLVFGQLNGTRTFTKPKDLLMTTFQKWVARMMIVVDYVDVSLRSTTVNAAIVCHTAGATEAVEMASAMDFFGLSEQQLKEEVVCRCLQNMK